LIFLFCRAFPERGPCPLVKRAVTPTPFAGLLGRSSPTKFERGFNDRDESGVNAFRDATAATSQKGIWGNQRAGRHSRGAGNEGVGEHVRTRFHLGLRSPVKLRS